ncbi:hypothetical protein DBY68_013680 [Pseudocitrobacter sp. RIT415]|nr:hypothetical protein DBY68_013680 [Pseudocitrobacter sp. RIT 415]
MILSFSPHACIPFLFRVAYALAALTHPSHVLRYAPGMNERHPCLSPKAACGCSNSFLTNLSLVCRLQETQTILGIRLWCDSQNAGASETTN